MQRSPWGIFTQSVVAITPDISLFQSYLMPYSIPELGRSPGGGHGNPLQYSFLENPMDRGAWRAIVHRVTESDMTDRKSVV